MSLGFVVLRFLSGVSKFRHAVSDMVLIAGGGASVDRWAFCAKWATLARCHGVCVCVCLWGQRMNVVWLNCVGVQHLSFRNARFSVVRACCVYLQMTLINTDLTHKL